MSPKQRVAKTHKSMVDAVRDEIRTVPPRFLVIEKVDKPSIPIMFSISRRGDCE